MEWLLRLEAAPGDAAVRAEVDTWLARSEVNRQAFLVMSHTWGRLGDLPREGGSAAERATARSVGASQPGGHSKRRLRAIAIATVAAMAASVAIYFFLPILQIRLLADHTTGVAELQDVLLEDGTIVHLDAGSAISVKYGPTHRDVALLAGQAFFEVTPGPNRPFSVIAGEVSVTVTGTAFTVRKTDAAVAVEVQNGTVDVAVDGGNRGRETLRRGQRAVIDRASHGISRGEVEPDEVASWRSRRLVVHDAPLDDVVEQLGRYYGGLVVVRDRTLGRQLVTGVFDLGRPAEALKAVAESQSGKLTEITPYVLLISTR